MEWKGGQLTSPSAFRQAANTTSPAHLVDLHDHAGLRLLASRVNAGKVLSKVVEHGSVMRQRTPKGELLLYAPKESSDIRGDEVDTLASAELVDFDLLVDRRVGQDHDLNTS
jgi:hypothetical protein